MAIAILDEKKILLKKQILRKQKVMKTKFSFLLLGLLIPLVGFSQWDQLGSTFEGSEINQYKGYSLSLSASGYTVAIGSPLEQSSLVPTTLDRRSSVQVYRWNDDGWGQLGDDILGGEPFLSPPYMIPANGKDVKLSADGNIVAMVENPTYFINPQNENDVLHGDRCRVFEFIDEEWQQIGEDIFEPAESLAISADGSMVVLGARYDSTMADQSGIVKVFHNVNNEWVQLGDTFYGTLEHERLGTSIDLSSDGSVLAIGATGGAGGGLDPHPGYVKIYNLQGNDWVLDETIIGLYSDDGWGRGNWAGSSVALSDDGNIVAFGGSQYRNSDGEFVGNVRVFQNVSGAWEQVGQVLEGGKASHDNTKSMVALSANGNVLAFGTSNSDIKVYQNINDQWQLVDQELLPESTNEAPYYGQVVSLSADGSILGAGFFAARVDEVSNSNGTGISKIYQNCNLVNVSVLAGDVAEICIGSDTTLTASIEQDYYAENGTINWYENFEDVEPLFIGGSYDTPEIDETTRFWVEGLTFTGCPSDRVEVVINPREKENPTVVFSYSAICTTDTSVLPILSEDFRTGGTFYTSSSLIVNASTGAIDASNSQPGTYTVFYEVEEDTDNCIDGGAYEFDVTVEACTIQRGISPNNDGLNDAFDLTGYNVKKLSIYNRYGKEIYSKTNYTNQWEGQDNKGNALPTGTYFYSIDKNNDEQLTGWVYINREL